MIGSNIFSTKNTEMYDPMKFTPTFKEELAALKKVNQFGKKLALSGEYIMYQGMLFGYDRDSASSNYVSIGFIDPKLLNILSPFIPRIVKISGADLYSAMQGGTFIEHKEYCNRVELIFESEVMVNEEFEINKFAKYACEKGFTDFEIVVAYKKGWDSNMDVYNLYLKYLATLKAHMEKVKTTITLQYTNLNDPIAKKVIEIVEDIQQSETLAEYTFEPEEITNLINSEIPIEIELDRFDGGTYLVRIMKNLFVTCSTSSKLSIIVRRPHDSNYDYLETVVETSGNIICNIFKVIPI